MRSRLFWYWVAAVVVVWVTLWLVVKRSEVVSDRNLDTGIILCIGSSSLLAAIGMLAVRRTWSSRALGVFGVFLGTGWFWFTSGLVRLGWRDPFHEGELYAVRSVLIVSTTLFLIGFWEWVFAYRAAYAAGVHNEVTDRTLYNGPNRRNGPPGRRRGDRIA